MYKLAHGLYQVDADFLERRPNRAWEHKCSICWLDVRKSWVMEQLNDLSKLVVADTS